MSLPEITRGTLLVSSLLAVLLFTGWSTRARGWAALLGGLGAVVTGFVLQILVPSDLWALPAHLDLQGPLLHVLGLGLVAALLSATPLRAPAGPAWLVAPAMGALFGELGGAVLLARQAPDRPAAARLALGAAAGGMVARWADPSLALLAEGFDARAAGLCALSGLLALGLAAPRTPDLGGERGSWSSPSMLVAALGLLLAQLPVVGSGAPLLVAAGLVLGQRPQLKGADPGPLLWSLGSALVALVALAAGLGELMGTGLEQGRVFVEHRSRAIYGALGLPLGLLLDGPAAALLARGAFDRALGFDTPGAALALGLGAAAINAGPLVVAGALRAGLGRLLLTGLLVAALSALAA